MGLFISHQLVATSTALILLFAGAQRNAFAQEQPAQGEDVDEDLMHKKDDSKPTFNKDDIEAIEENKRPGLLDTFSLRVSFGLHGLVGSKQGRPLIYPDISARYKTNNIYVDARLPAVLVGMDYGQYWLQKEFFGLSNAFWLFEAMNQTPQYVQGEVGMLRVGQTWSVLPGKAPAAGKKDTRRPLLLSAGIAAVGDWAVMEARLLSEPLDEDASIADLIITDPIVLGVGLFGAVGRRQGRVYTELALMIARDLFQWDSYARLSGFVISPDAEVVVLILDNFGLSFRTRFTLYTHVKDPRAFSIQVNPGVIVNF